MKRIRIGILCAGMLFLLSGCRSSVTAAPSVAEENRETQTQIQLIPQESLEVTVPKVEVPEGAGEKLPLGATGCLRLRYNGNVSSVRYVTAPDQLPDEPELSSYDEAFFTEKALVLVMETVNSGSVEVGIRSICLDGNTAVVTLQHELPGDVGTTVMTTWLLWAEVEKDLSCAWTVENPALPSGTERS